MCAFWVVAKVCVTRNWIDGICIDNHGNIFFTADSSGLWKWNIQDDIESPECLWEANKEEGTNSMRGIIWNGNNKLYICEESSYRILQYDLDDGVLSTLTGTGQQGHKDGVMTYATFWCPWGIDIDAKGNLYVTDQHCIRKISLEENSVQTVAGSTSWVGGYKDGLQLKSLFRYLTGILLLEDGTIYTSDSGNGCIRKITEGQVSSHPGDPITYACFGCPRGIALDIDGNILVADFSFIRKLDTRTNKAETVSSLIGVKYPRSLARYKQYLVVGTLDQVIVLENMWIRERLLWIGKMKEDKKDCLLVLLPVEIVREIASFVKATYAGRNTRTELPSAKKLKM